MSEQWIIIGKIVAPHGVRGDVRVIPLTDFPERFSKMKTVSLDSGQTYQIESTKEHKQFIILKLKGLNSRNDVESLKGHLIQIPREDAMPLPEDRFYIFDLIGLKVYDEEEKFLGVLTDVLQTGSNDVYIVEESAQAKPLLIPALKKVVLKIDLIEKIMIVKLQEEWEES